MVTHAQWHPAQFYSTMTSSGCYILWKPRRQLTTRSLKKERRWESKIPSKPSWYFPQARQFKRVQRESRFSWHSDGVIDVTRNRIFECLTYKTSTHVSKERRRRHTQTQQRNAPSGLEADQRSLCHRSWQSKRGEQEICTRQKKKWGRKKEKGGCEDGNRGMREKKKNHMRQKMEEARDDLLSTINKPRLIMCSFSRRSRQQRKEVRYDEMGEGED